jgi:hypothetical protein
MAIKLIFNTLGLGTKVVSLVHLDALVERARESGSDEIEVAEPRAELVAQVLKYRANYEVSFRISK